MQPPCGSMRGKRLLVVEDEFHIATEYERLLEEQGAEVLGPVGDLGSALRLIESAGRIDAAVLDINIYGNMVFPIAHELRRRGVPMLFATGYEAVEIPSEFSDVPLCQKPVDRRELLRKLPVWNGPERPDPSARPANGLLAAMPAAARERLLAAAETVELSAGQVLSGPGMPVTRIHFVLDGICSLDARDGRGGRATAALVGPEGATDLAAAAGAVGSAQTSMARIGGRALRVPVAAVAEVLEADGGARAAAFAHCHALYLQASATGVAAARHTLECRVARLLLMCLDRIGRTDLALTHASLAEMLGTRRPRVTEAVHLLESTGVIKATRANIRVLDRTGLEEASCGSYVAATDHPRPVSSAGPA